MNNPLKGAAAIRVLVVDDHPIVREGLVAVLNTQSDISVVGEASDGGTGVLRALSLKPDVILMDLEMPKEDGPSAIRRIIALDPGARIIVFTAFDHDDRVIEALRSGASGYLLKGSPRERLFEAVRTVHAGGTHLGPEAAQRMIGALKRDVQPIGSDATPLTPRQREVLSHVAQGLQNSEIAAQLGITERTVKFHVSAILSAVGAGNRTEAVALARQQGLLDAD